MALSTRQESSHSWVTPHAERGSPTLPEGSMNLLIQSYSFQGRAQSNKETNSSPCGNTVLCVAGTRPCLPFPARPLLHWGRLLPRPLLLLRAPGVVSYSQDLLSKGGPCVKFCFL